MKTTLSLSVLVLLTALNAYGAKSNADESALRELTNKFTTAWNQHDSKALTALWAQDATAINPSGRRASGRAEITKLFQDEHTTFMKSSQGTMNIESFRFPKPGFAFLDIGMELSGMVAPDGKPMGTQKIHVVALATKQGKTWWFQDARAYAFLAPPPEVATTKN
jgi:uncharacterized protein (TIGR02246 family)